MSPYARLTLAAVAICLLPTAYSQTKSGPPAGSPSTPPTSAPSTPSPQVNTTGSNNPWGKGLWNPVLLPSLEDAATTKRTDIGQGTIYAPERNVPKDAFKAYRKGLKALSNDDIRSAEGHLLRATQLFPKYSSAFTVLGIAYSLDPDKQDRQSLHNEAANSAFHQALALNPNNELALQSLGARLVLEHASAEAERVLRTAIAVRSSSIRPYVLLMLAELQQQHYANMLATGRRIPRGKESEQPIVYYLRAVAWEQKPDRSEAIRDYREFLKYSSGSPQASAARDALQRLEVAEKGTVVTR